MSKNQTNLLTIDVPIIVDAAFLHNIQVCMGSSGEVNVFQRNKEWFFSRRVKFDSWFNVMAVSQVSWHGQKIVNCSTGIRKWVVRLWKRPFWFFKKIYVSNWVVSYQGGCSQFLISSRKCVIRPPATGKMHFPFSLGNITSFALSLRE